MIDLKLDHVSKKYNIPANGSLAKRWYRPAFARRSSEMWALRDVSFEVQEGEALGIVGHNGAGKTTILKLLSSITAPSQGQITIRGRLAALVEVSSGFHPELTGKENVFLHGAMLGMRRAEIVRKLDSIVEFSGVGRYIDVPVKRYSSGMYVRLGFSIAAHLEPDILLLDEVLAVGDVAFQIKCLERIAELRKAGRTIVFVSHDIAAVYRLCDRAILLVRGQMVQDGPPRAVIDQYQRMAFAGQETSLDQLDPEKLAECTSIAFFSPESNDTVRTGYPMIARLGYRAAQAIPKAVFRISLYWPSGYLCAQLTNDTAGPGLNLQPGAGTIEFQCPVLPVVPGLYRVDLSIESNGCEMDRRQRCATLCVDSGKPAEGDFYIENQWIVSPS
jgi:ABC-type polysaccharide/polyol phosphate transport system ATPase subunit